jgi:hypothetical protein
MRCNSLLSRPGRCTRRSETAFCGIRRSMVSAYFRHDFATFCSKLVQRLSRRTVSSTIPPSFVKSHRALCELLILQAERQATCIGNYGVRCIVGTQLILYLGGVCEVNDWVVMG